MRTKAKLTTYLLYALATFVIVGMLPAAHAAAGTPRHAPAVRLPIGARAYAIGDSVMLDAAGGLESAGIVVDAAVSRQFIEGIAIAQWLRAAGRLPGRVVIGLGTNGPFTDASFDTMMRALRGVRRVVFVTVKEPRWWEGTVNSTLWAGVARWPKARLADWHAISWSHPSWFWADGIHLTPAGAAAYARLAAGALNLAYQRCRSRQAGVRDRPLWPPSPARRWPRYPGLRPQCQYVRAAATSQGARPARRVGHRPL